MTQEKLLKAQSLQDSPEEQTKS